MFRYMDSAIPDANGAFEYTEHVSMGEDGKIYLYVRRREEKQIYTLSNEEQMEEENSIVLVDMTYGESYVNSCTTKFNYLGQEQKISYKKPTGTLEDNWNHVMAEFALGKGPDMILVYPDDEQWKALFWTPEPSMGSGLEWDFMVLSQHFYHQNSYGQGTCGQRRM